MYFQATNLHAWQPNTHCVMLTCHEMERGNEFHLYGTEEIGRRFLSYQSDCVQRLFHLLCAANSNKRETAAATVTTGHNDNNNTVQPSAIPINVQTGQNETGPTSTGQNPTGLTPTSLPTTVTKRKNTACGSWQACTVTDCGQCINCLDKPRFGGPNKRRRKCVQRICKK